MLYLWNPHWWRVKWCLRWFIRFILGTLSPGDRRTDLGSDENPRRGLVTQEKREIRSDENETGESCEQRRRRRSRVITVGFRWGYRYCVIAIWGNVRSVQDSDVKGNNSLSLRLQGTIVWNQERLKDGGTLVPYGVYILVGTWGVDRSTEETFGSKYRIKDEEGQENRCEKTFGTIILLCSVK